MITEEYGQELRGTAWKGWRQELIGLWKPIVAILATIGLAVVIQIL